MKSTKTKEQVVDAYENRLVLKIISGVVVIGGIVLAIVDMLKRGVDIDANAIARHNKREL